MISKELRNLLEKASIISVSLDSLYDQKDRNMKKKKLVGGILLSIDETINYQEERLRTLLLNLKEILKHGT